MSPSFCLTSIPLQLLDASLAACPSRTRWDEEVRVAVEVKLGIIHLQTEFTQKKSTQADVTILSARIHIHVRDEILIWRAGQRSSLPLKRRRKKSRWPGTHHMVLVPGIGRYS